MRIKIPRGWELPESAATPLSVFRSRRRLIQAAGGGLIWAGAGLSMGWSGGRGWAAEGGELYPAARNPRYGLDRALSESGEVTSYNNFYEFGIGKRISRQAQALPLRPWQVAIDGMVAKPQIFEIDALLKAMPLEERLYRHRCVEAWAMAVPWTGFPLASLVEMAQPLPGARYVELHSFMNPEVAPLQRQFWYPWPYSEGLTLAEATNELAFLASGLYGKPLTPQNGAPLRLAVPWKYGFKSIKSIVRLTFTDSQPVSFWERLQPSEYGFWANVNPNVPHKRWSQKSERLLGTDERVPTQLYNGYGEFVAGMYPAEAGREYFY